jgi:hypothetical protein
MDRNSNSKILSDAEIMAEAFRNASRRIDNGSSVVDALSDVADILERREKETVLVISGAGRFNKTYMGAIEVMQEALRSGKPAWIGEESRGREHAETADQSTSAPRAGTVHPDSKAP